MSYSALELLAVLIVTGGIMLQTWIGIGFGLVSAPLLYLINPAFVPGPILIIGSCLSLLVVSKSFRELRWRRITPAILTRLPGAWLGAWLLTAVPQYTLSLLFGSSLLLAVLVTWKTFKVGMSTTNLCIGGFFSGMIGTATSVGGPPMALVYQESDRITARNEIAAFFLIGTPISVLMLALQGAIDQTSLELSFKMVPGLLIGFWLARRFDNRLGVQSAKPLLLGVCSLSALMVLYKGIVGWLGS